MSKTKYALTGFGATVLSLSLLFSSSFAQSPSESQSRLEAYNKLRKVIGTVENYYVDEVTINEIINKAIDGLLSNLDAHSSYLNEKKYEELKVQTDGEFGGVGITISMKDGALTIISPIEDTPGDKAGLKSGDIILKIDDKSTLNMTIDDAINLMRGKPKTKVKLTIVRKNEPKPFVVDIIRDVIKVESVYAKRIENSEMLYVRVTSFDKKVGKRVAEELKKASWAKGVVLDLRNNPGGLLNQAVELTDLFINEGVIVSQKGRISSEDAEFKASKNSPFAQIPLAVLINNGSASASEIVAGALQDHKRAILVGENTFGKGSVQVVLPLDKNEGLRLTIARYYLPSGRTIQALGITPDLIVHPGVAPREKKDDFSIKESELKQHLENELEKIGDKKEVKKEVKSDEDNKSVISEENLWNDIQLKSAMDALKTWSIINPAKK
ncbi:S41 family peptidase [Wolinella succinogenes]|uniref:PROTEASE n=1 Tax=Wolinella succinogenes (strain ATCC 29543 / DSM 1740 / CCUG 13145 / JCM 31913 / LMG 7466 / NCTC 11488 / FDC 602W) TaxID=273121 RepID=Q7MSB3_WOLSU|nr:S41 family peptidase [Wolinella succinogenes]CAE09739.1 PROTEASE [Wolinella succinogenes]VEG81954.1 Carboxy-terminal processing protease CtpB precursor [Wolinella succinogenes]HCZ19360.1 S41 family peptidase [Helicobacter sp.]